LHVSFNLRAAGEAIGLFTSDGTLIDAVSFGPQTANFSQGRFPDGGPAIDVMSAPTPRGSNAPSAARPDILSISVHAPNVVLVIWATPGFAYLLEYTDDLASMVWTPLGTFQTATTSTVTFTDQPDASSQRFYRARRSP